MKFIEKIFEALKGRNHSETLAIGSIALIYLVGKLTEGKYEATFQNGNFSFRPTPEITDQKPHKAEQNQPAQDKAQPAPEKPEQKAAVGQEEAEKKQSET